MPIRSYLAYPQEGKKNALAEKLNSFPHYTAIESSNNDVLILVTDSTDDIHEQKLQDHLNSMPELSGLALVFAQGEQEEHNGLL